MVWDLGTCYTLSMYLIRGLGRLECQSIMMFTISDMERVWVLEWEHLGSSLSFCKKRSLTLRYPTSLSGSGALSLRSHSAYYFPYHGICFCCHYLPTVIHSRLSSLRVRTMSWPSLCPGQTAYCLSGADVQEMFIELNSSEELMYCGV